MKKHVSSLAVALFATLAFLLAPASARASWTYDPVTRTIADGQWNLTVTASGTNLSIIKYNSYSGSDGILDLSAGIDGGYRLVGIRDCVFANLSTIKRAVLPDSVTSIGYQAFYTCGLTNDVAEVVPQGVAGIGALAFQSTSIGGTLTLTNVAAIGDAAFGNDANLKGVHISSDRLTELVSTF